MINKLRNNIYLLLALFIIIFNFIIFINFPIFPDEITNNYLATFASIHQGQKLWLIDSCSTGVFYVSNVIRLINTIYSFPYYFIDNNITFRLIHLLFGSILFLLMIISLYKLRQLVLYVLVILVWPLSMINSFIIIRPEYFIVLMVVSMIYSLKAKSNLALIILSTIYLLSLNAHPKALYFIPLLLYFFYYNYYRTNKNLLVLPITLIILYISYEYFEMYKFLSVGCQYEYINNILAKYQVSPFKIFTSPKDFIFNLYQSNDLIRLDRSISQILLRNNYDIGYLPNIIKYYNIAVLINALYIFLVLYYFYKVSKIIKINLFVMIYLFTILIIFLLNANKASYDIYLYLNLLILLPAFGVKNEG